MRTRTISPKGSTKRRRFSKKTKRYYKSKKRTVKLLPTVKLGRGFPKKAIATLCYNQTYTSSSVSGVLVNLFWSANGLYNPGITVPSHQPFYFDQYMALYNHYHCIGSKIIVSIVPATSNALGGIPFRAAVFINDDTNNVLGEMDYISERSTSQSRIVNSNANRPTIMSYKWSAKKSFGSGVMANDELKGTALANPVEQQYYNIAWQPIDKASSLELIFSVRIEYICVFNELKDVSQS